jgi:transcription antitermination factor NusA-like protein
MVGAAEVDSVSVLILRGSDISTLRANPTLMKEVKEEFQRQVWFIEAEATDRRFMENLFFPCKVQSINLIWLPDGSKLTKVVIESRCESMVPFDLQQIQKIAQTLRNIELHIEFEKPE